jgi:hypothetical protein
LSRGASPITNTTKASHFESRLGCSRSRRVRPSSAPGCTPDWERASAADGSRLRDADRSGTRIYRRRDALSEELVVGAHNRPREGRGQQLAAGVSLKGVEGSEDPADEQGVVPRVRHSRTA